MNINIGDWVMLKETYTANYSGYSKAAFSEKAPLKVYKTDLDTIYCMTTNLAYNNFLANPFVCDRSYLEIISEKEALERTKFINSNHEEKTKKILEQLNTKHIPIADRKDYNLNKTLLNTNYNFAKTLYVNRDFNKLNRKLGYLEGKENWLATCCDFSKCNKDIAVYIPKTWLTYFGYSIFDLIRYINFLKGCNIGFNAKVLKTVDLHKEFRQNNQKINFEYPDHNYYVDDHEVAYEVLLKSHSYSYITYLYFILVRYIYNHLYWNIPFIAMKLKKNMPDISNWDCLLLAHNMEIYNNGYSLADLRHSTEDLCLIPKYNSSEFILEKLMGENPTMNKNFVLTLNYRKKIAQFIKDENYTELKELIK